MALSSENEPVKVSIFGEMVGAWRIKLAAKQPSEYTPKDWQILALLQLREAWLMHGQGLDSSRPLSGDPLKGLRRLDLSESS